MCGSESAPNSIELRIFLLVYCNIEWMTEHFQLDTELFLLIVFLELFHGACSLMPGVNLLAHVCCC